MQPDRPQFSARAALLISIVMTVGSIFLSLPMYLSAEVRHHKLDNNQLMSQEDQNYEIVFCLAI